MNGRAATFALQHTAVLAAMLLLSACTKTTPPPPAGPDIAADQVSDATADVPVDTEPQVDVGADVDASVPAVSDTQATDIDTSDLPDVPIESDASADVAAEVASDTGPIDTGKPTCAPLVVPLPPPATPGYLDSYPKEPCANGKVCNDQNPCTDDTCGPDGVCWYAFNKSPCQDPCGSDKGVCDQGGCGVPGSGSQWAKSFGGSPRGIVSAGGTDVILMQLVTGSAFGAYRLDADGHVLWSRMGGGMHGMFNLPDGSFVSYDDYTYMVRQDPNGDVLWSGNSAGCKMACGTGGVAPAGCDSVIVAGATWAKLQPPSGKGSDPVGVITLVGPDGKPKWWHYSDLPGHGFGAVAQIDDGTILVGPGAPFELQEWDWKNGPELTAFSQEGKKLWYKPVAYAGRMIPGQNNTLVVAQLITFDMPRFARYDSNGNLLTVTSASLGPEGEFLAIELLPAVFNRLPNGRIFLDAGVASAVPMQKSLGLMDVVFDEVGGIVEQRVRPHGEFELGTAISYLAEFGTATYSIHDIQFVTKTDGHPFGCEPVGLCKATKVGGCTDGNPCTMDHCEPKSGCVHINVSDGAPCGPSLSCKNGKCMP